MKYIQNGILSYILVEYPEFQLYEIYTEWNFERVDEPVDVGSDEWNIYRMEFWGVTPAMPGIKTNNEIYTEWNFEV